MFHRKLDGTTITVPSGSKSLSKLQMCNLGQTSPVFVGRYSRSWESWLHTSLMDGKICIGDSMHGASCRNPGLCFFFFFFFLLLWQMNFQNIYLAKFSMVTRWLFCTGRHFFLWEPWKTGVLSYTKVLWCCMSRAEEGYCGPAPDAGMQSKISGLIMEFSNNVCRDWVAQSFVPVAFTIIVKKIPNTYVGSIGRQ